MRGPVDGAGLLVKEPAAERDASERECRRAQPGEVHAEDAARSEAVLPGEGPGELSLRDQGVESAAEGDGGGGGEVKRANDERAERARALPQPKISPEKEDREVGLEEVCSPELDGTALSRPSWPSRATPTWASAGPTLTEAPAAARGGPAPLAGLALPSPYRWEQPRFRMSPAREAGAEPEKSSPRTPDPTPRPQFLHEVVLPCGPSASFWAEAAAPSRARTPSASWAKTTVSAWRPPSLAWARSSSGPEARCTLQPKPASKPECTRCTK